MRQIAAIVEVVLGGARCLRMMPSPGFPSGFKPPQSGSIIRSDDEIVKPLAGCMAEPENERMAQNLAVIGWSTAELSRRIGVRERTVRRMLAGSAEIPPALAQWVEGLAIYMAAAPPLPDGWRPKPAEC